MMLGGGLMMGIGLLMLLAVIGIPVLLVVALAGGTAGFLNRRSQPPVFYKQPVNMNANPVVQPDQSTGGSSRSCSHCGAALQADWSHCPQCGAPVSQTGE